MRRFDPRLTAVLLVLALLTSLTATWRPAKAEPEADCMTSTQAKEAAQKVEGSTATYLVGGWVGSKIEVFAGDKKIGCTAVEAVNEQYVLAVGDNVPLNTPLTFKRNGKRVVTNPEVSWRPNVVVRLEMVKPVPDGEIKCDYISLAFANLADRYNGTLSVTMSRPWGEASLFNFPIVASPGQPNRITTNYRGLMILVEWRLVLEGEIVAEGIAHPLTCDTPVPTLQALSPARAHPGDTIVAYTTGLGEEQGRLLLRLGNSSRDDIQISEWTNWQTKFTIPQDIRLGNWNLIVQRRIGTEWVDSNSLPLQIFITYNLYLPSLNRRVEVGPR